MYDNQVESISVPSSASIHEKNAMKAFASVWQIKTGETAFFQSEEVIFFNIIMIVISTITIVIKTEQNAFFLHFASLYYQNALSEGSWVYMQFRLTHNLIKISKMQNSSLMAIFVVVLSLEC